MHYSYILNQLGCLHTKFRVNVVSEGEDKSLPISNKNSKSADMESLSSNLTVSNASATGSGRSKVALKPGHSLMDWIRLTHSGKDLTSTGGRVLEVSTRELAKHNTKRDAWIALKGKVYNITPYLDYHPGGEDELMRGAGKDATDLFNQVHQWVNAESMLQKCFVGVLKKSWSLEVPKFPSVKLMKKQTSPFTIAKSTLEVSPETEKKNTFPNGELEEHIESTNTVVREEITISLNNEENKMILRVTNQSFKGSELITDLSGENLYIKFNKDSNTWLNIRFPNIVKENYGVKMIEGKVGSKTVELIFDGNKNTCSVYSKADLMWTLHDMGDKSAFWPCKLVEKTSVNYNTYLFTFLLPLTVKMWIPIGCHVFLKSDIEGMEIIRSYTPVIPLDVTKQSNFSDGSYITLMIKIYPSGTLTPALNMYDIGKSVFISNYAGSFSASDLEAYDSIVMIAAGTGITPMIRIIIWALTASDKKRSLLLLFFNKTEEDILWNVEFENCSKCYENFQVIHILSEPSQKWSGHVGSIHENLLKSLLPTTHLKSQINLVCGPLPFTNSCKKMLENLGSEQELIYAFTG